MSVSVVDDECWLGDVGSEFLGARINVRHAAKKPPGQQHQQPPRGKGYYTRREKPGEITNESVIGYFGRDQFVKTVLRFMCRDGSSRN